jgi:hypothetical protein
MDHQLAKAMMSVEQAKKRLLQVERERGMMVCRLVSCPLCGASQGNSCVKQPSRRKKLKPCAGRIRLAVVGS